jgi:hypothetical protein
LQLVLRTKEMTGGTETAVERPPRTRATTSREKELMQEDRTITLKAKF